MDRIGFICDIRESRKPTKIVGSARLKRAVPMSHVLREHGVELFAFSRRHVNPRTRTAFGYVVEADGFRPLVAPVPRVNGNWFLGNARVRDRSGLGRAGFDAWTRENGIEMFPHAEIRDLTTDKYRSHCLMVGHDPGLSPHLEQYGGTRAQLGRFVDAAETVFLKPRYGSMGEAIVVLGRDATGRTLSYYAGKERTVEPWTSLDDAGERVAAIIGETPYVIQEGVDVMRLDGGAFIVRVIMLNDGRDWTWTHKLVASPDDGDVANTTQGGVNHSLEDALPRASDPETAARVTEELRLISFAFTGVLDGLYPGMNIELAYDFLVRADGRVFMAEFDVHPGLMKPGMNVDRPFEDIFRIRPEEQDVYDRYVVPHATRLAHFLLKRLDPALVERVA